MLRKIPDPRAESPQTLLADGSLPPTLGPVFVAWAEAMLCHGEGDLIGQPFKCPTWLVRAAYRLFEYDASVVDPVTGCHPYLVQRALIISPKGSAKTEGAAAFALFLLAGPSQPTPDGPKLRPSANIPIAASSWDQANKLFGSAAVNMATGMPDSPAALSDYVECFDSEIQLKGTTGKIYRVAAIAGTNDGGLPTSVVCDEIHEWTGKKKRFHLVLTQGLEKRSNGLEINITTPDTADPDTLLGGMVTHAERVASGEVVDPELYYLRYGAPDSCIIDTEKGLAKALALAHPAEWVDPVKTAHRLLAKNVPPEEIRRYWLAQFVPSTGHWLPEGTWDSRFDPRGVRPPHGTKVVLGFDGSYRRDSTALVGCTLGGYIFVVDAWERPTDAPEAWRVPRSEVKAVVAAAMKEWEVVELAPDPPGWNDELEQWEAIYGDVVVAFSTNQGSRMGPACTKFYSAIAGGDEDDVTVPLTHDGDARLARHLRNAVPKFTLNGTVITKRAHNSPLKIDIAIAAIVAYDRATWHATNVPVTKMEADFIVV